MIGNRSIRCDRCKCQNICKIEEKYREIQKKIDETMNGQDSYFSIHDLMCSYYTPNSDAQIRNVASAASNERLNEYIKEANRNGRA